MTVSLGSSLASEGICLFVDLWEAPPCLGDPEWDSSQLDYPVRDDESILTWLDFSLHFRSCCLLRVCRKFGPKFASHYKPVENEVSLDCSNHIRRTKSSIKKRIIVCRSVRSMFGRTNIHPVKNRLKGKQSDCVYHTRKGKPLLLEGHPFESTPLFV